MRPKLGRPNIARYSNRFSVPTARSDAPLSVTWMGVATLLVDDGSSALMTDGYFSRPGLARVAAGKCRRQRSGSTVALPGPMSPG